VAEHPPPAMTVRDVAGFLAVDEKTIYRLAQQGKLPGFKVAGTWRFQLQDIQGWIDEQKKKQKSLMPGKNATLKIS
jgi:excisionase family DNA binding protein